MRPPRRSPRRSDTISVLSYRRGRWGAGHRCPRRTRCRRAARETTGSAARLRHQPAPNPTLREGVVPPTRLGLLATHPARTRHRETERAMNSPRGWWRSAMKLLPPAFDPYRSVFLFIVGSLGLGVAGNAAYDLLTGAPTSRGLLVALLLGAPLGGVIFGYLLGRLLRLALKALPRQRLAIVQGEAISPRRGLIVFV